MTKQAGAIEPSELKEVARLVKQAATVIDQMLVLNNSIDLAASNAVTHYRSEARLAEEAADRVTAEAKAVESERENMIVTLSARVQELEALLATQKSEIEALRTLIWPQSPEAQPPRGSRFARS